MIFSFLSEYLTWTNTFYAISSFVTLRNDSMKRGLPWIVSGLRTIQCTPTPNSHGFQQSPGSFARNCYLFWSRLTQSSLSHPICKLPILLLTSQWRQGSPVVFPSGFPTKRIPVVPASLSHSSYATWLDQPNNILCYVQITMSIFMRFFQVPCYFPSLF